MGHIDGEICASTAAVEEHGIIAVAAVRDNTRHAAEQAAIIVIVIVAAAAAAAAAVVIVGVGVGVVDVDRTNACKIQRAVAKVGECK